ncbi:FHA domain-containing protein [Chloroflexota bacterium]
MNCGVQLAPVASVPPPPPTPFTASEDESPEIMSASPPSNACPNCGLVAGPNDQLCNNCGVMFTKVTGSLGLLPVPDSTSPAETFPSSCSNCGSAITPIEKYCNNCGLQISALQGPVGQSSAAKGPAPSQAPAAEPSTGMAAPASAVTQITGKLVVQATKAEIVLSPGKTVMYIGRSDPVRNIFPDIDLTIHGGDSSGVSRRHARLSLQNSQIYLEDLNSTNFTFVNRQKLQPGQKQVISHGDEIRLGLLTLEYFSS